MNENFRICFLVKKCSYKGLPFMDPRLSHRKFCSAELRIKLDLAKFRKSNSHMKKAFLFLSFLFIPVTCKKINFLLIGKTFYLFIYFDWRERTSTLNSSVSELMFVTDCLLFHLERKCY